MLDDPEKTAALNKRLNEIHEEFGMSVDPRPLFAFKGSSFISDSYYEMFKNKGGSEEYTIVAWYKKDLGAKVKPMVTTQWNQLRGTKQNENKRKRTMMRCLL